MKKRWILAIIFLGLVLEGIGFTYDVLFAGIPYQDPSPEMAARYQLHATIAAGFYWCGLVLVLGGALTAFYRMVRSGRRRCAREKDAATTSS